MGLVTRSATKYKQRSNLDNKKKLIPQLENTMYVKLSALFQGDVVLTRFNPALNIYLGLGSP